LSTLRRVDILQRGEAMTNHRIVLWVVCAWSLTGVDTAGAYCISSPIRYRFQNETVEAGTMVTADTSCNHFVRAFGYTIFTDYAIAQHPTNGTLRQTGQFSVTYTPKSGFRGADVYAIRICGKDRAVGSGCSTIRYNATVQ